MQRLDNRCNMSYIRHKSETSPLITAAQSQTQEIGFRPLYLQVKATLLRRLVDGVWQPGTALPSEGQLAAEIGVSQGTVRKALDELAAENIVIRRQGRGTFVAEHDERRILFQFFKLARDDGERRFPESSVLEVVIAAADEAEIESLGIEPAAQVIRIRRVRSLQGRPIILETLSLPHQLFSGLETAPIPNNLYSLYAAKYGVTIARAREKLKAVALLPDEAMLLDASPGFPALKINRVALSLEGSPVELRVSLCLTEEVHYLSDLL